MFVAVSLFIVPSDRVAPGGVGSCGARALKGARMWATVEAAAAAAAAPCPFRLKHEDRHQRRSNTNKIGAYDSPTWR